MPRPGGLGLAFGPASLAAVALGAVVLSNSGAPAGLWGRNLAAWAVGSLAFVLLARFAPPGRASAAFLLGGFAAIAATFLFPGQEGVHRWIQAGPLRVNAAMVALPAFVAALAWLGRERLLPWLATVIALAMLAAQPDASQATALGVAMGVLLVVSLLRAPLRLTLAAVALGLVAIAWLQPDPLAPVPEVEGVLGLAWRTSPALAVVGVAALATFTATPLFGAHLRFSPEARSGAIALAALFAVWCLVPAFGAFPVPLVGAGMSPVLGAWLGAGLLAACLRRSAGAPRT